MKIGILTFHRAHNYGAVLQCFALQQVLKEMGHDVEVIDYKQPHIESYYRPKLNMGLLIKYCLRLRVQKALDYIQYVRKSQSRILIFNDFIQKHLQCSVPFEGSNIPQDYDRYIIGSDQVWTILCTYGYDPIFWGNFPHNTNSKIYGYAISANGDYNSVLNKNQIITNTINFEDISFREQKICDDINAITGKNYRTVLDPTLLTNSSNWDSLINEEWKSKKYIVVYEIRKLKRNPKMISKKAKVYAKQKGLEVIDLSTMTYSVSDFVSAIKYAQCVFTSSFHATVFSVIFGTPFYSFKLNDGHDGRYTNLLSDLDLTEHIVDENSILNKALIVDRGRTDPLLRKLQTTSVSYIDSIIKQ